jgi:hypothetical protein
MLCLVDFSATHVTRRTIFWYISCFGGVGKLSAGKTFLLGNDRSGAQPLLHESRSSEFI